MIPAGDHFSTTLRGVIAAQLRKSPRPTPPYFAQACRGERSGTRVLSQVRRPLGPKPEPAFRRAHGSSNFLARKTLRAGGGPGPGVLRSFRLARMG
jgi:hypothetical protein